MSKRCCRCVISALLACLAVPVAAYAQCDPRQITMFDRPSLAYEFGFAVGMDGDTIIIGAYQDDLGPLTSPGAAYIYTRSAQGDWGSPVKIQPSDAASFNYFGYSVALSGDTAIIGAKYGDSPTAANTGAAYIFVRSGANWVQQAKLTDTVAVNSYFGTSVAIDGDTAVVGAPNSDSGTASVFVRTGTVWTLQQQLQSGHLLSRFGAAVALRGDTAVIGAPDSFVSDQASAGAVQIFTRSGTTWTRQTILNADDAAGGDNLGAAVAISGDTVIAGAPGRDAADDAIQTDAGAAYVFTRAGATWTQQARIVDPTPFKEDYFGGSVAISGNTALVGAYGDGDGSLLRGSAYIFDRVGTDWPRRAMLAPPELGTTSYFGYAAAMSRGDAVISAALDGQAYVFTVGCPVARDVAVTVPPTLATGITLNGESLSGAPPQYLITSLPAHGTLIAPSLGALVSTPIAIAGDTVWYRPDALYIGPDAFHYRVSAGGDSEVADVDIRVGAEVLVHDFPLDSDPGWSTQGQWAFGTPTGGGTHAHDPLSGFTGPNVYGFNLAGDYPNGMSTTQYLTTTPLDLTGYRFARLEFRRWLGVEFSAFDHASIQASADGAAWGAVWDHTGDGISESAWSLQSYDLSALDDQPAARVRWGLGPTDGTSSYPGWNLDDIHIYGVLQPTSACPADLNADGLVDFSDYLEFLNRYDAGDLAVDFNADGLVDFSDYLEFLNRYDAGC